MKYSNRILSDYLNYKFNGRTFKKSLTNILVNYCTIVKDDDNILFVHYYYKSLIDPYSEDSDDYTFLTYEELDDYLIFIRESKIKFLLN